MIVSVSDTDTLGLSIKRAHRGRRFFGEVWINTITRRFVIPLFLHLVLAFSKTLASSDKKLFFSFQVPTYTRAERSEEQPRTTERSRRVKRQVILTHLVDPVTGRTQLSGSMTFLVPGVNVNSGRGKYCRLVPLWVRMNIGQFSDCVWHPPGHVDYHRRQGVAYSTTKRLVTVVMKGIPGYRDKGLVLG